jgi:hypothetical protein
MSWVGRGNTESRLDQRFVMYMTAIECLVSPPKSRGAVTERIRTRVAHLLQGQGVPTREIYDELATMYDVRSELVHGGVSGSLTESMVGSLRQMAGGAILRVAYGRSFRHVHAIKDLEEWFIGKLVT